MEPALRLWHVYQTPVVRWKVYPLTARLLTVTNIEIIAYFRNTYSKLTSFEDKCVGIMLQFPTLA
ncbi:hypothetical protein [Brasilonema bromeliae]|uniref:hypothetical protein n=1 Tax=Brasilonema bromeliae TaxID=383615 RepID=UPI00145C94E1|nr:hypothetical protein [Brasilonema bromeliae]